MTYRWPGKIRASPTACSTNRETRTGPSALNASVSSGPRSVSGKESPPGRTLAVLFNELAQTAEGRKSLLHVFVVGLELHRVLLRDRKGEFEGVDGIQAKAVTEQGLVGCKLAGIGIFQIQGRNDKLCDFPFLLGLGLLSMSLHPVPDSRERTGQRRKYDSFSHSISKPPTRCNPMTTRKTDVLIIGGGPAGSTFGSIMAGNGWDVTLLEKDRHPRFHIGESLLPMNMPILQRLGVLAAVRRIGVPKLGADFTLGNSNAEHKTFYFREALGQSPAQAFEVRRSEFDQILFENCKAAGVRTLEETRVRKVELMESLGHKVSATDAEDNVLCFEARFLVDASGRDAFISSANGWKKRNRKHATAAVFGHFRGVTRRAGEDEGNISLYWFEQGWIWMIPLQDGVMSIGAVCMPSYLRTRRGSLDEFLLETLNSMPETRVRIKDAVAAMPAQATGNYSYVSERMWGPGYLMLGDAFAFIDPVFSSGVYLAMTSAEKGIAPAEAWLSGNHRTYRKSCQRFEREMKKGLAAFSWFIYRFTTPAMSNLMANPRNVLQVMQAVISMLAGDVFSNHRVRRRLLIFKSIYLASWVINWRKSLAATRVRATSLRAEAQRTDS